MLFLCFALGTDRGLFGVGVGVRSPAGEKDFSWSKKDVLTATMMMITTMTCWKEFVKKRKRDEYLCYGELKVKLANGLCSIVGKGKHHVDCVA